MLCTGLLLVTNVLAAWLGADEPLWRAIMVAISIAADLGLIGFLFAMVAHHQNNNGTAVFAAFLVWMACGTYTGISSTRWLEGQFRAMDAPVETQREITSGRLRAIEGKLSAEAANLTAASSIALNGRTRLLRRNARSEAAKIRKRISELEKRKWKTKVEERKPTHVQHTFRGYEWAFPLAALIVSQVAWYVTFGGIGHGQPPRGERNQPTNQLVDQLTTQPTNVVSFGEVAGRHNQVTEKTNHSQPPNHLGDHRGSLVGQPISTSQPTSQLVAINQPTNQPATTNQPAMVVGRPTSQPTNVVVMCQSAPTDDQIAAHLRAGGLSERALAAKLNTTRSRVQRVKKQIAIREV